MNYIFYNEYLKVQKGGSPSIFTLLNNEETFKKYYNKYIEKLNKKPTTM